MLEYLGIKEFESYSTEYILENLNFIFKRLINTFEIELKLKPLYPKAKILIEDNLQTSEKLNFEVLISANENDYIIKVNRTYKKFIKYILLREIYYIFIPFRLRDVLIVYITINQIIFNKIGSSEALNKWKSLIRENLINYKDLVKEDDVQSDLNRLDAYLNPKKTNRSLEAIKFFISHLRNNSDVIQDSIKYLYDLFFEEFAEFISTSLNSDEILETIRCITLIFKRVKSYKNILQYKTFFQVFKENGEIISDLSLRRFTKFMDWLKKYTYLAPSYQLNWNTLNVNVIVVFLTFHPLLFKKDIIKIITNFPFFTAPKISYDSFSTEISGYVVIPQQYIDDFLGIIKKFKSMNYLIDFKCLLRQSQDHVINLNYFKDYFQKKTFVNDNNKKYESKFEIEFNYDFGDANLPSSINYLDLILLDRIRWFSVSGFGFERRSETLNILKSDLINGIVLQRRLILKLKELYKFLYNSSDFENNFLDYIYKKKNDGIFKIRRELKNILYVSEFIDDLIKENQIENFDNLKVFISNKLTDTPLESKILIENTLNDNNELFSLIFSLENQYKSKLKGYSKIYDLLDTLYELKIFNFDEIEKYILNKEIAVNFINKKEKIYNQLYEKYNTLKITNQEINKIFEKFLTNQPPIIEPLLINSIITKKYVNDFLQLILVDSQEVRVNLKRMKKYFPRMLINYSKDLNTNQNLIYVELSTPELTVDQKFILFSIMYNLLKNSVIYAKNLLWGGIIEGLRTSKFYDFENKNFYYSKNLYDEYFKFAYTTFGKDLKGINNRKKVDNYFFSDDDSFLNFIKSVNSRVSNLKISKINFNELTNFHQKLTTILLDDQSYKMIKNQYFFKKIIKSIEFIPSFQKFGLSQYYIYLHPYDFKDLNMKTLLNNNFQSLDFTLSIGKSNSFVVKYIDNEKNSCTLDLNYLDQLKKKNALREYSCFKVKKFYDLVQFKLNMSQEGWNYDPEKFKLHIQNILNNPEYHFDINFIKEYDLSNEVEIDNIVEISKLIPIYSRKSVDIKSYLGTNKVNTIKIIKKMLKEGLINPYLNLKNIGLDNCLTILIPGLTEESKILILRVMGFFNVVKILEVEGNFFINGFKNEKKFNIGLYLKIFLPSCDLNEFLHLFDVMFELLEIKEYLILRDLVKGNLVITRAFGTEFLKDFNPLLSL